MKKFLSILCVLISFMCFSFTFSSCEKTETPLSEEDKKVLRYYREPSLDEPFHDNRVMVSLKSAFANLKEIRFEDFKAIEKISKIVSIQHGYNNIITSKNEVLYLEYESNQLFDITIEDHSKEKVLKVIQVLKKVDIVLVSSPKYIYDVVPKATANDTNYISQWGLNGENGINIEQAWDITRGSTSVKVGIIEANIDKTHEDLSGKFFESNYIPNESKDNRHGTMVAGIIGAKQNNSQGVAGIAECSMCILSNRLDDFESTLDYAKKNGIKIINMSSDIQ